VVLTALTMSPISCFYFFTVLLRTFQPRTEVTYVTCLTLVLFGTLLIFSIKEAK